MRQLREDERQLWDNFVKGIPTPRHEQEMPSIKNLPIQVKDLSFNCVLDLHHCTLNEAHRMSNEHIERAFQLGKRRVQHITGKSGQISQEFETWARLHSRVRKIQKQNDGGAWLIFLKKS